MAQHGIRTFAELIGRTDLLCIDTAATDKARGLDLSPILESAGMVLPSAQYCMFNNAPFDKGALAEAMLHDRLQAIQHKTGGIFHYKAQNRHRSLGDLLSKSEAHHVGKGGGSTCRSR